MSEPDSHSDPLAGASHEEASAALFADLVVRQVNMAMMFLGQVPHPETGGPKVDLEAARLFIDQLEALEVRTRGNLTKPEEQLVRQGLTNLRMLFVQVSSRPPEAAPATKTAPAAEAPPAPAEAPPAQAPAPAPAQDDPKVKFSKKY
jgi:hypothetical protein